jgi:hypothetical protein
VLGQILPVLRLHWIELPEIVLPKNFGYHLGEDRKLDGFPIQFSAYGDGTIDQPQGLISITKEPGSVPLRG